MKGTMNIPEHVIHAQIVQYLRLQLPASRFALHHSNNEACFGSDGRTNIIRGARAKAMGQLKGYPDIEIIDFGKCRVIWLEVKSAKGAVRPEQKAFLDRARAAGFIAEVVRSVDDARAIVGRILA